MRKKAIANFRRETYTDDSRPDIATLRAWLENQITATHALIGVWDMTAFQRHLNDGFLG